VRALKNEF